MSLPRNSGLGQQAVHMQLNAYNKTMQIKTFQIIHNKNISLDLNAASLDGMTAQLAEGFYSTFCTLAHGTRVLGLKDHLLRLYEPAKKLGLYPPVVKEELRARIAELVKINLPFESRVRVILTKAKGELFIGLQPFESLPEAVYKDGVKVVITETARSDPRIKDTGFITSSAEQRKLIGKDVFELLLAKNGKILEGMTSNFYAIVDAKIITTQRGILLGVTRKAVLSIAKGQGMSIEYRSPKISENFDEAFLTSSSRGVVPIVSIDKNPVGQGKVGQWTKTLSTAYRAYVEKRSEKIVELNFLS